MGVHDGVDLGKTFVKVPVQKRLGGGEAQAVETGSVAGCGAGVIDNMNEGRRAKALFGAQLGGGDEEAALGMALADVAVAADETTAPNALTAPSNTTACVCSSKPARFAVAGMARL